MHIYQLSLNFVTLLHFHFEIFLTKKKEESSHYSYSIKYHKIMIIAVNAKYFSVYNYGVDYCCVPEGRDLHQTARPPGCDETRSVNPLVRGQVD